MKVLYPSNLVILYRKIYFHLNIDIIPYRKVENWQKVNCLETRTSRQLNKMAYRLSKFSRPYLDQKMADILEYFDHRRTKHSRKSHSISIETNGCHIWDKFWKQSGYKTVLLTKSSGSKDLRVRVECTSWFIFFLLGIIRKKIVSYPTFVILNPVLIFII